MYIPKRSVLNKMTKEDTECFPNFKLKKNLILLFLIQFDQRSNRFVCHICSIFPWFSKITISNKAPWGYLASKLKWKITWHFWSILEAFNSCSPYLYLFFFTFIFFPLWRGQWDFLTLKLYPKILLFCCSDLCFKG